MYDLNLAALVHPAHADADDRCPLCIADEIETKAEARLNELTGPTGRAARGDDPLNDRDGGRLHGQFVKAAMGRLDVAEAIRSGDVTITSVERSKAFGMSIRYR